MTLNSHTPHKKARIEIIPLIDIMFFLLASFMLVSMSMVKLQKLEPKLPASKTSTAVKKADFVVIGIDKDGKVYYDKDKDPVAVDVVVTRLAPVYAKSKDDTKVFINCDKGATYNQLVAVLDAVRGAGIRNVNFAVTKGNSFDASKPRTTMPNSAPSTAAAPAPAAPAAPATNP